MRRKTIVVLCLALVGAFALTAAGCGGGGSKSAATTEAATTEAATTEATTTQAEVTSTESKPTTTTSELGGIASAANCKELTDLGQKFSAASGASDSQDLKKQAALLKEFADKTPSDIRPDFEVVASYLSKVAEVAGSVKPGATPDPATLAKLQKIATEVDQQKLAAASKNISAWVTKNCHK